MDWQNFSRAIQCNDDGVLGWKLRSAIEVARSRYASDISFEWRGIKKRTPFYTERERAAPDWIVDSTGSTIWAGDSEYPPW